MAQGIFLDRSNVIEMKVEDDYYRVSYGFHEFACFHKDDAAAKREPESSGVRGSRV